MDRYQTEQRKKLIEFFQKNKHLSFAAKEIYQALKDESISMSAVYRNLADMEKLGNVCRVNGKNRIGILYKYMDPDCCKNKIHLKCEICEEITHFDKCISDKIIAEAEKQFNFIINNSASFLYGRCKKCSQI